MLGAVDFAGQFGTNSLRLPLNFFAACAGGHNSKTILRLTRSYLKFAFRSQSHHNLTFALPIMATGFRVIKRWGFLPVEAKDKDLRRFEVLKQGDESN
jgi:hypothetical protein